MFIGSGPRITAGSLAGPALNLDLRAAALDSRLVFTRASGATDVIGGVLTSFGSDTARVSAANGLLMEETRTNLAFGGTLTNGGDITVTGSATDPLGGTAAFLCTEAATTAVHTAITNQVSFNAGTYVISAFVKANGCDRVQLRIASTVAANAYVNYYLNSAGGVSSIGAGALQPLIQALSNGWYRISFAFVATAGQLSELKLYSLVTGSEVAAPAFAGTSRSFYAYGCQCELGAFLTSYIPTTAVAATRATENCILALGSWFNSVEGTLFAEAVAGAGFDATTGTNNRLLRLDDGTSNNLHEIRRNVADGTVRASTITGGVTESNINIGAWAMYAQQRAVYAYRNNDMASTMLGATAVADTASPEGMPVGLTTMRLGGVLNNGAFNGYVRLVRYWRQRLSNEQLKAMTT